jgi:hypothetical protein
VTLYDLDADRIEQRFFSAAHDGGDAALYQGRVVYPAHPWLGSHLVYSVFDGGHWQLHISQAGSTADLLRLPDLFAWDLRDLDGDGVPEVIASPAGDSPPSPVGAYLPDWRTAILAWDPAVATLRQRRLLDGIPYLTSGFRESAVQSVDGWLYPVLTGREGGALGLFTIDADGTVRLAPLGP